MRNKTIHQWIIGIILLIIAVIMAIPVIYALVTSFKTEQEIIGSAPSFFPRKFTLQNYSYIFERKETYLRYYWNSIIITVFSVLLNTTLATMMGYAFARLPYKGRELILGFILFIITFPIAVLLIPIYIMEYELDMLNRHIGLILPNVTMILPFSVFIMRGIFKSIPLELEQSAEIDGAGVFATWWKIMLPIGKNAVAITIIYGFYNIWGEYILAKTLATEAKAMPLTVGLTLLKGEGWNYGILGAVIFLAILPPVLIFTFFQRQLVEGLTQGALKG
jgi:ABC-type glycerol-3-phosphate transport system permease component